MSYSIAASGQKPRCLKALEEERARLKDAIGAKPEEIQSAERLINHARAEINLLAGDQDTVLVMGGGTYAAGDTQVFDHQLSVKISKAPAI